MSRNEVGSPSVMLYASRSPVLTQEVYPNPESFDPERFLKDGSLDKNVCDRTNFIFGFGRRCVRCCVIATYCS
jgi:cytochrome P450